MNKIRRKYLHFEKENVTSFSKFQNSRHVVVSTEGRDPWDIFVLKQNLKYCNMFDIGLVVCTIYLVTTYKHIGSYINDVDPLRVLRSLYNKVES